ncbi:MAG: hypothetical protein OXU61_08275 [Gammaproteobacteria bacterium]|nr:hypothetical protein [Gammaproteobacteria bacterium]
MGIVTRGYGTGSGSGENPPGRAPQCQHGAPKEAGPGNAGAGSPWLRPRPQPWYAISNEPSGMCGAPHTATSRR